MLTKDALEEFMSMVEATKEIKDHSLRKQRLIKAYNLLEYLKKYVGLLFGWIVINYYYIPIIIGLGIKQQIFLNFHCQCNIFQLVLCSHCL